MEDEALQSTRRPPFIAVSSVLGVAELAMHVAHHLEGEDLFKAFSITVFLRELFYAKSFWRTKLGQHGLAALARPEMGAFELRHIYQHQIRTIEAIKMRRAPLCYSHSIRDSQSQDSLLTGPNNMVLIFQTNLNTQSTDIFNLEDLDHKGQLCFEPESIFAGGRLCIGWERKRKVIRNIDDWSLVVDGLAPHKSWMASGTEREELLCICREAGLIEMWDSMAQKILGDILHVGLIDFRLVKAVRHLVTASNDGIIQGLEFGKLHLLC